MEDNAPFWKGTPSLFHSDYPERAHFPEYLAVWIDFQAVLIILLVVFRSAIVHFLSKEVLQTEVLQIKENPEL